MKNRDIDAIISACAVWVHQHHRTSLTAKEASAMRVRLKAILHSQPKPSEIDMVRAAHRLANDAVAARRDHAMLAEHQRMAAE